MYESYFGLSERPFSITPDPRFVYLSPRHEEALAHLLYGVRDGGGFIQLTGEVGTGKTTLCRCLLDQIPEEVDVALILNPRVTPFELVAAICDELRIAYPAGTTSLKLLIDVLNRHLIDSHARGRHTVVLIDEAQDLTPEVLEQVRLLTNLETAKDKLLQIILVGQTELRITLARIELRQLAQRVTARYHLTPLDPSETRGYIVHRLAVAGTNRPLFTESAMREIYRYSSGVPRLVNVIADRALLAAYAEDKTQVTGAVVKTTVRQLEGEYPQRLPWWLARAAGIGAIGLMVAAALGGVLWWQGQHSGTTSMVTAMAPPTVAAPAEPASDAVEPAMPAGPQAPIQVVTSSSPAAHPSKTSPAPSSTEGSPETYPPGDQSVATLTLGALTADQRMTQPLVSDPASEPSPHTLVETPTATNAPATAPAQPVADAPRVAPAGRVSFSDWLHQNAGLTGSDTAFSALFELWGATYAPQPGETLCDTAEAIGLQCMVTSGNWATLQGFNRPAVIELWGEDGLQRQLTVSGLTSHEVSFRAAGTQYTFPVLEVSRHWLGNFLILWQQPEGVSGRLIKPGTRSDEVVWLRTRLAALTGHPIAAESDPRLFDPTLERAVQAFQSSRSLRRDGIVGAQTFIHLNSAIDDSGTPSLSRSAL